MKKSLLKTFIFLFISTIAFAQSKDEKNYKERAAEVQEEVWNSGDKAFTVTAIPEKYVNASAVIIARSIEVTNSTKRKFKMITIFLDLLLTINYLACYTFYIIKIVVRILRITNNELLV